MKTVLTGIRARNVFLAVVFVFLVLVGHTAYWLHDTIYRSDRFGQIATEAITTETSRQSIGDAIVNRALSDRPIARQLAGERLSQMVAALIGTDLAETAIQRLVERGHLTVTTPHREPISYDTTAIKQQIVTLQSVIDNGSDSQRFDASRIPDEIVILDTTELPDIHRYGVIALWIGVTGVITLLLGGAWYIYHGGAASARLVRLRILAGLIIVGCGIALLVGPLTRPVFLTAAQNAPEQTLLRNVFDGFVAPFNAQAQQLGWVALGALGLTYFIPGLAGATKARQMNSRKASTS